MPKYAIYSKDSFLYNLNADSQEEALKEAKENNPEADRAEFLCEEEETERMR